MDIVRSSPRPDTAARGFVFAALPCATEYALLEHRLELLGGFAQLAVGFLQLEAQPLAFAGGVLFGGSAHAPLHRLNELARHFENSEPSNPGDKC